MCRAPLPFMETPVIELPDALCAIIPTPEQAEDPEFIAHALAQQCRFNGHLNSYYSVASHSVNLANYFLDTGDEEGARYALLHDAPEAWIGDVISPIKHLLPLFMELDDRVSEVVMRAFGLSFPIPDRVKEADSRIVADESYCLGLVNRCPVSDRDPLGVVVISEPPVFAAAQFLRMYYRLFRH